jgi:hypothetical protein
MEDRRFRVIWERTALNRLGKLFNIDHDRVYKRSKILLSLRSYRQTKNVANYSGFEYNGYLWALIHNAIIIYRVSEEKESVFVESCYYANTEASHEIFWGIDPEDE